MIAGILVRVGREMGRAGILGLRHVGIISRKRWIILRIL